MEEPRLSRPQKLGGAFKRPRLLIILRLISLSFIVKIYLSSYFLKKILFSPLWHAFLFVKSTCYFTNILKLCFKFCFLDVIYSLFFFQFHLSRIAAKLIFALVFARISVHIYIYTHVCLCIYTYIYRSVSVCVLGLSSRNSFA